MFLISPFDTAAGAVVLPPVSARVDSISPTQQYVCGFLFTEDRTHVAVICKRKPAWQAGKLNGIGGKVEPGEAALSAMVREFAEETGVVIAGWHDVAILQGPDFVVHFFAAFDDLVWDVQTMEEEEVFVASVPGVLANPNLMPNLRVFLPLALDESGIARPVHFTDERWQG